MKSKALSRIVSYMLMVSMLITQMSITSFAAIVETTGKVSVGTATGNAGDTNIKVPIIMKDSPLYQAMGMEIYYDSTALTLTEIQIGKDNTLNGVLSKNVARNLLNYDMDQDYRCPDGEMYILTFTIKQSAPSGVYEVRTAVSDAGWNDSKLDDLTGTFTPGQITVNAAPPVDCRVNFIDGATTITKTAQQGSVMTDLPAEPAKAGHIFAGWYAGAVTGANADYIVTGNDFAGTEFRPKYDIVAASADYHAVWIPQADTAAYVKAGNTARIWETYTAVQSAINSSAGATTVKMLTDCAQKLTIPAGKIITLDMNGHKLASATDIGIDVPGGTLSVENSSGKPSAISAAGYSKGIEANASVAAHILYLRDIQINNCSTGVRLWPGTIDLIENCDISGTSYGLELIANFGGNSPIPSTVANIVNTKITGEKPIEANNSTSVQVTTASMKSTRPFHTVNFSRVSLPAGKTWGAADTEGYHSVVDGFTVFLFKENKESFVEGIYVPAGTAPASAVTPPEKPGSDTVNYVFDGWADANGVKQTISAITESTTLYATYREEAKAAVAQVGSVQYPSVNAALKAITAAAGKTGTIKLIADVTWDDAADCMAVPAGANITLDFAGHKISSNANAPYGAGQITNNGTLLLTSTGGARGTIEGLIDSDTVVYNAASGKLSVQNLNILGEQYSIQNAGGTVEEISGCKLAPDANHYAVTAGLQNDYGTVTLVADTESTRRICNGNGSGNAPTTVITLRNVTIGTPTALADVGIENANNAVITAIENCTVHAASMAIFNRGTKTEPGTIGNVTGGRYYSKCDGATPKPTSAPDVVYAAVVNYGNGDLTLGGGAYKGGLHAQQTSWGEPKKDIKFAAGKALGTEPDADGYYAVQAIITAPPALSGDKEVAAVPDTPMGSGKTTLDATSGNAVKKTEIDMPASFVGSMDQSEGLSIKANAATVAFDSAALGDIKTNAAAGAVKLAIAEQTVAELPEAQKLAARDATKVLDLKLTKGAGESVAFAGGTATIAVDYVQQDPIMTVNVYHIADDGTKTKRECKLVEGKLSFTTSSFSTYIVAEDLGQKAEYTMAVKTTAAHYNPGDTITANIVATAPVATAFGSCQFTLGFDAAALELQTLTGALTPAPTINGAKLAFASTDAAVSVGTGDTVIATATFKVKSGITTGTSVITLLQPEMTYKGIDINPTAPVLVPQTVNLHNLAVTFAAGANSTMVPESATAYAKYNTAGLWTTEAYTMPFTFPAPTAKAGYRLAEKLWGDGTNAYTEAQAKALALTENKTFTVQTVQTATVSFAAAAGGTIAAKDPVTVDAGTKLSTIALPAATAHEGYSFTGWHDGTNMIDPATYTIDQTITLTAKFAPNNYAWLAPITTNTAFAVTSGVSAGNEVTHGTPIVFTATPNADYVITGVSYSVGGAAATALTPAGDTYTIPGEAILGTIQVEIATQQYHSVTFKGTAGAALADQTAYVKDSAAGLYTDTTFQTPFTVPKLTAEAGYRLAADTAAEPLWKDTANTGYTSVSIAEAMLTADAVLTAQTVKTWNLSFAAGANGSLTYTETALPSKTVDSGYVIKATDIPATVGDAGYVFDAWDAAPLGAAVGADITYTASFKHGTYAISFSTTGATFTPTAGVAAGQVTHGTDVTFTMTEADGYKVTAVKAQIGSAPAETLAAVDGAYTILGDKITGDVSVTVESNLTYVVNFAASAGGTLTGSASKTVNKDYVLQTGDIPTPTANLGYAFAEWQVDGIAQAPLGHKVIAPITFTAVFTEGTYAVTTPDAATATVNASSGLAGGNATYNTPVVFTVTGGTGKIVNKVYYTVAGGAKTELTTTDGTYTLPGSVITAPVTISVDTLDGTISFISALNYKAAETGKQMLVFETAKLTGNKYTLTDGAELYWSSKYGAYVRFVADTETERTLSAKLTTAAGAAAEIKYDGNLNSVGAVTAADAGIINDILHNKRVDPTTDMHRFEADVNGEKTVTTQDVTLVLNMATGL